MLLLHPLTTSYLTSIPFILLLWEFTTNNLINDY